MVLAVEIGDIGGPGAARAGDLLGTPCGELIEDVAAALPVDHVFGAADWDNTTATTASASAKQIIGVAFLDHDRIVYEGIAFGFETDGFVWNGQGLTSGEIDDQDKRNGWQESRFREVAGSRGSMGML